MVGGNHVSHQHINQLPILNQDTLPGKKKDKFKMHECVMGKK